MYRICIIVNGIEKIIEVPKPLKEGDKIFKENGKWYVQINK